jgi:hypothetical protein
MSTAYLPNKGQGRITYRIENSGYLFDTSLIRWEIIRGYVFATPAAVDGLTYRLCAAGDVVRYSVENGGDQ